MKSRQSMRLWPPWVLALPQPHLFSSCALSPHYVGRAKNYITTDTSIYSSKLAGLLRIPRRLAIGPAKVHLRRKFGNGGFCKFNSYQALLWQHFTTGLY